MNISITFRQVEPSAAIKKYAESKIGRLQKLLQQPLTAKVTLSVQKQHHVADVHITSGNVHVEAKEVGEELYASIDQVVDKLERQISGAKGEKVARSRRTGDTVRKTTSASIPPEPATKATKKTSKKVAKKATTKKVAKKTAKK